MLLLVRSRLATWSKQVDFFLSANAQTKINNTALCKKPGNRKSRARKKNKKCVCLFQQQQLNKHSHIFINKTPIPLLTSKLISRNIQATTLL